MDRFPLRTLVTCFATALCATLGAQVGQSIERALLGGALASAFFLALFSIRDFIRSRRLMNWLAGEHIDPAPRGGGSWAELGYRAEKAVRLGEKAAAKERGQLAQFLSAIEASPNGVMLLDATEHIQWFNRVAADHFALDPGRDLQQRVTNLVRAPAFVSHLQSREFRESVTFASPRGDGVISVVVRPYGEAMRIVLSQDITDRERSDTMRRNFVANVSHEIRSPLTVLAGFVDTMARLSLTDVERARVLVLMEQQTSRMQSLVADLLALAQIEGAPKPSADRWILVGDVLTHVETSGRALSRGQHEVQIVNTEPPSEVGGVESELVSAVWNLVSNALRYTPAGGQVTVSWCTGADGTGVFKVADTGIGIAQEHLPRLTERFYRVDGSRSRETGGTGLGLAIVKHVVQRHGGELEITSELGVGSVFSVVLPAFRVRKTSLPAVPNPTGETVAEVESGRAHNLA